MEPTLGLRVRLHALDGDDLGVATVAAPFGPGDVLWPAEGPPFVAVQVVASPPGSVVDALAKCRLLRARASATN